MAMALRTTIFADRVFRSFRVARRAISSQFPKIPKLDLRVEGVYTTTRLEVTSARLLLFQPDVAKRIHEHGNLIGSWMAERARSSGMDKLLVYPTQPSQFQF